MAMALAPLAATMAPEMIKMVKDLKPDKDNNVIDYIYQPVIKIPPKTLKAHPKLLELYPTGEMPNPNYPNGIRVAIPAWLAIVCVALGIPITLVILAGIPAVRHQTGFAKIFKELAI